MHRSVLFVDDDDATLHLLTRFFRGLGWEAHATKSPQQAITIFETVRPSLVILDLHLPFLSGLELLEIMRHRDPDSSVVMLTGQADVESAVTAMRLGAQNYLIKPVSLDHLEVVATTAIETTNLRRRNRVFSSQQGGRSPTGAALHHSAVMQSLEEQIMRVAETDVAVLLQGETGTGKSWLAKTIHRRSARASAPLIEVDCAGLSEQNMEQRLFGEERMTSRGKRVEPRGLFELADGGVLLLDHVEVLHPDLQPKLLSVLATQRFRRVGGDTEVTVDVRIIAAAGMNLEEEVSGGRFREDLYYRLAVFPLRIPSLREQARADILQIAEQLVQSLGPAASQSAPVRILPDTADLLARYQWPGNVREMRNALERILILYPNATEIRPEDLPPEIRADTIAASSSPYADPTLPLEEVERRHIGNALKHYGGNKSQVAQSLRIGRRTLYDKMAKYDLE
jgi:two-component system nitrogen regulation response regulator NtrX